MIRNNEGSIDSVMYSTTEPLMSCEDISLDLIYIKLYNTTY